MGENKVGAPSKYTDDIPQKMLDYFDIEATRTVYDKMYDKKGNMIAEKEREVANSLPTIEGFCKLINVSKNTLHEWLKDDSKVELQDAYKKAKDMQEAVWQENSLKGLYNPIFTIFMGKNVFGWKDKQEISVEAKHVLFEGEDKIPD